MTLSNTAQKVWQEMMQDHTGNWGMDIEHWDWVPGVGLIAMLDYYEATGKPEVLSYLKQWIERNKEKTKGTKVINSIAPFAIFPALYRLEEDVWFRDEAVRIAEWMIAEAPRTREMAFEHTVTENAVFSEQVWADTLFMAVLFLARTASLVGSAKYAEEALQQVLIHLSVLQDESSGVLFHGWNCDSADHMSAARWTRANAWVAAGVPLIVKEIGQLIPVPAELKERYERLISGLISYQQEDGLWSTVMDHPEFYREVSGSAGIGYGIRKAMEIGLIERNDRHQSAADRALAAVLSSISEDGVVSGVSGGTPVMKSIAAYQEIPQYPTLYGQGLALMLLADTCRDSGE
ncbi:glycoside hydrolase family 88 protein [Paenibacillus sp. CGMCC 1.16610]|uniref:Glycosyl hydrolase n=1 Tax=Paenibacillus anseongense TaxID=2682845 RepID=A0ABW9U4G1_9BACL|nr:MULTISPECIES: glycoside hydrolase family 88 protein [Paenibacillus]MBA2940947.1 glycoside hydrolase family 88 protein [Paenibacillus sp. CGMCC 1.16610]MVQ34130.1 glycosyl hydrolase [Paenibacillus anseongense]